jgi:hypothetical protein
MPRQSVLTARQPTVRRVHHEAQRKHQLPQATATVDLAGEQGWWKSHTDHDWGVRPVNADAVDHVGEGLVYLQAGAGDFRYA